MNHFLRFIFLLIFFSGNLQASAAILVAGALDGRIEQRTDQSVDARSYTNISSEWRQRDRKSTRLNSSH